MLHRAPPGGPALEACVVKAAYLGKHVEYTVAASAGELLVIDRGRAGFLTPGTDAWVTFAPPGVTIIPA